MDLNHLHLHAKSVAKTRRFYETHFGFRERTWHGDVLFLRNRDGFDLDLGPSRRAERFPEGFRFGFRLPTARAVRRLHGRIPTAGELHDSKEFVVFRCWDPDGRAIEGYWE